MMDINIMQRGMRIETIVIDVKYSDSRLHEPIETMKTPWPTSPPRLNPWTSLIRNIFVKYYTMKSGP
jgi:hypothetical protein